MTKNTIPAPDSLRPSSWVRERYAITEATLGKWIRDPRLGFPAPVYINTRRLWRVGAIEAWEATLPSKSRSAA